MFIVLKKTQFVVKRWQHRTSYTNNKIQKGLTLETKKRTSLPGLILCIIVVNEDDPATESPSASNRLVSQMLPFGLIFTQAGDALHWKQLQWVAHLPRGSQLPSSL